MFGIPKGPIIIGPADAGDDENWLYPFIEPVESQSALSTSF